MSKKNLVIGDIHGCATELDDLLRKAERFGVDDIYCVGDLINKGPDSRGVLERVVQIGAKAVIGNHEQGFLRYVRQGRNGHADFDTVRDQLSTRLDHWCAWLAALPSVLELDDFWLVHGGFAPDRRPEDTDPRILTRIRTWDGVGDNLNNPDDPPWYRLYEGEKPVVYGHWAIQGLVVRSRTIGLDTGCVYGGALTAVIMPERRLVQVPARAVYRQVD